MSFAKMAALSNVTLVGSWSCTLLSAHSQREPTETPTQSFLLWSLKSSWRRYFILIFQTLKRVGGVHKEGAMKRDKDVISFQVNVDSLKKILLSEIFFSKCWLLDDWHSWWQIWGLFALPQTSQSCQRSIIIPFCTNLSNLTIRRCFDVH